jgi:hypothetical protein
MAFSTHPPTVDRLKKTRDEISRILPARELYIVTTAEFDNVKARLRSRGCDSPVTSASVGLGSLTLLSLFRVSFTGLGDDSVAAASHEEACGCYFSDLNCG